MNSRFPFSQVQYGWYIVVALSFTEIVSWGILYYGFSVFIKPIEDDVGWSRGEISAAFSIALLCAGLAAIPVGYWLDRFGARGLMTAASICATAVLALLSAVQTLAQFYVLWACIGLLQACLLYEPAFVVIAKWFTFRRSTALAVLTFTAGFASTVFLPLIAWLIQSYDWRSTFLILAAIIGLITIPLHGFILRKHPVEAYQSPPDTPASNNTPEHNASLRYVIRNRTFWLIIVAFALASLSATALRIHFIPYLIDRGFDQRDAATIAGLIGAAQVLGRLVYAPFERYFATIMITRVIFALQGLAILLLLIHSETIVFVFVVCFGGAFGAMSLARPMLLVELYGPKEFGQIKSISAVLISGAVTIGPIGAGVLYEIWGHYEPLFYILPLIYMLSIGMMWLAQRPPAKPISVEV
ncbi:MAG: MFS transporter [Chloroflexi bacterium]|nr:MFS transporter [Chloroflexota bacterium]